MAEKQQFRAIKGTRDILPPDTSLWNWFEATARRVMESYGYREIRLPIFEQTELFARSIGADTDVVSKEMYSFEDRPSIREPKHWEHYEEFLSQLETALREQTIPGDEYNRNRIVELRETLTELTQSLERFYEGDKGVHPRLQPLVFKLGWLTREIRLGDSVTLRPEATASVVRAYIEHGMHTNPGLTKLYYVGPMFRRERPQKGRYRQFYQIGAEALGQSDHPAIDAEIIEMLTVLLGECGLEKSTLLVNSIGCRDCRPKYMEALRQALEPVKAKMCVDCQRRAETNALRVLDCKVEADQPIIAALPAITDHLDAACRDHFLEFQRQLTLREIPFTIAPRLVRGLDYYMRTTFEITSAALGAQNALVGGGRYDGLSELLGGPPAKGIGFALGTDRFILAIDEAGKVQVSAAPDALIAWIGAAAYGPAVKLARKLRAAGLSVEVPPEEMKLKKSLGLADKLGARYAILLGDAELAEGKYVLRRMADGEQQKLSEAELIDRLRQSGS